MIETILEIKKDNNRKSCLMMAIRSARYLSGRDVWTGKANGISEMEANVLMKDDVLTHRLEDELFFAGISMYLIAIDCIGCLFENKRKTQNGGNGIKRALKSFTSLDDRQIDAIIDLRNTLAHNFGLATELNCSNGKPKKHKHKFTLSFSDETNAINLPKAEWDGNYDNKEEEFSTIIGVSSFCNLAEGIIADIYKCHDSGVLKLRISENEAKARFTVLP